MKLWAVGTVLIGLTAVIECIAETIEEKKVGSVWSDPNDPTLKHRLKSTQLQQTCQNSQDQSLRLIIRQMMHDLRVDPTLPDVVRRNVEVKITKHQMTIISKYLNDNVEDTNESREMLRSALTNIFIAVEDVPEATWRDSLNLIQPFVSTVNLFLLPAAGFIVFRSIVRPRNFWILVVSTIIMVSMYNGYNKKYQEAEARKFAQFEQHGKSANACASEGLFERMAEIISSPFVYKQKPKCLQYIESQTVSIFHEISIIEVFSETVAGGFFAILSSAGKHFNLFFRQLYEGAPIIAQIAMTIVLLLMIGTVRTPFFSYEPLLFTFVSTSMGKVVGWLEGGEEEQNRLGPGTNHTQRRIGDGGRGTHQIERNKLESIEYSKSEREDQKKVEEKKKKKKRKSEVKSKPEPKVVNEHSSEDEKIEDLKDSESDWTDARNESSLSETSS